MQRDFNNSSSDYYTSNVNALITTNNLNYTTTLLTSTIIANQIIASNLLLLSSAKTYNAVQSFNLGIETKCITINSQNNNNLTIGYLTSQSGSQSILLGVSSSCNSYNSVAIGYTANANANYCVAIGALSNMNNIGVGNTSIGYNSGVSLNDINNTYNTCIGYNSNIYGSTVSNSCAIGKNSCAVTSNSIYLGTTNETVYVLGKLLLSTNYSLSYSVLPSFTSTQIGYINSITKSTNTSFVSYDSILNLTSISLTTGVYIIQYSNLQIALTSVTIGEVVKGWLNIGFSLTSSDISIHPNKTYFYTSNISYHSLSNSFYYICSTSQTIYLNAQVLSNDSTGLGSKYFISSNFTFSALRIA